MANRNIEFIQIIREQFPDEDVSLLSDNIPLEQDTSLQNIKVETLDEDDREVIIEKAARDIRIADYVIYGKGSVESLIAGLERDYNLSEAEADQAINRGIGQLAEIVDYDDEA